MRRRCCAAPSSARQNWDVRVHMMKPGQTMAALVLCIVPGVSLAQDCRDLKEGSTAWAGCVAYREDKALSAVYRKLEAAMNKPEWMEVRKRLIESQQAWLAYRERECQFVNDLAGGAGGANAMGCQADMTKARTLYLSRVLEQFK